MARNISTLELAWKLDYPYWRSPASEQDLETHHPDAIALQLLAEARGQSCFQQLRPPPEGVRPCRLGMGGNSAAVWAKSNVACRDCASDRDDEGRCVKAG